MLNDREKPYDTSFDFDRQKKVITITRTKCICGLVNKAKDTLGSNTFCECSTGHFREFFKEIFDVAGIELKQSILVGEGSCVWEVKISNTSNGYSGKNQ